MFRLRPISAAALLALFVTQPVLAQTASHETLARDLTVQQRPIYELGLSMTGAESRPARIPVEVRVDSPNATYTIGQRLRLFVRAGSDAHITVLNVGTSGRTTVLFPNHFQRNSRVRAGRTVQIPTADARWAITVGGPVGVDLIKVIATSQPITLRELQSLAGATPGAPMLTLGRMGDEVARDLAVQLAPPASAERPTHLRTGVAQILVRVVAPTPIPPAPMSIQQLPSGIDGPFELVVQAERSVYRVGEIVRLFARTRAACRLQLVHLVPGGPATQLFPNAAQIDDLIVGATPQVIPSPDAPLQFVARGPSGVQNVLGICRDPGEPQANVRSSDGFVPLGASAETARNLVVRPATERTATSFIVVE